MKADFIELFLGLSRRGKTTKALEIHSGERGVCYTAQFTNEQMEERYKEKVIYDSPEYLDNLDRYLVEYKDICILKRENNDEYVYSVFSKLRGCSILLDDITLLYDDPWPLVRFLATVGMNDNKCIITTHVPRSDMPKKVRTLAVKINVVGGWVGKDDIKYFYDNMRNIPVEFEEFKSKLEGAQWGEMVTIRQ